MTQNPSRIHERERAVQLINERWNRAHREYYDEHPNSEPLDPRLGEAVEAATVRIRSGSDEAEPGEGDDYPEALPESINGAYRDILGEFAPS